MNISLNNADKNKKRKKGSASSALTFGLNSRKEKGNSRSTSSNKNVFGDDDDSSDSDGNGGGANKQNNNSQIKSRREVINEQIAKEQAARRRRAQADLASVNDKSVYDYDGAYDSFQTKANTDATEVERERKDPEKKSKYIGDLLKAAKVRERERDVIFERRNAREQAEEDARDEYKGKEKFVTNSYKRKLQERKQWEAEQEEKDREEAANDVTKKSAGAAFAGFYGNLNRNAIMKQMPKKENGDEERVTSDDDANKEKNGILQGIPDDDFDPRQGFLGGFQRSSASGAHADDGDDDKTTLNGDYGNGTEQSNNETTNKISPPPEQSHRQIRERKVAEARERYLKRKQALVSDQ